MAATVKPKEDMPTTDSMSRFGDFVIVRLDHDREFVHHDSCLSYCVPVTASGVLLVSAGSSRRRVERIFLLRSNKRRVVNVVMRAFGHRRFFHDNHRSSLVERRQNFRMTNLRANYSISIREARNELKNHTFVGNWCTNIRQLIRKRHNVLAV
jgi:hypothetical protein